MRDKVGCFPTLPGRLAKRYGSERFECTGVSQFDGSGAYCIRQQIREHTQFTQDVRGVGGQLQACAESFQLRCLFTNPDRKTSPCESDGRREAGYSSARNDDRPGSFIGQDAGFQAARSM